MAHNKRLTRLQLLLENLPDSIPFHGLQSTHYSFSISNDEVEDYGDKTSAINHRLEVEFGSRRDTGGIVPIDERGPGICAVISVLANCPLSDGRIGLWIENLCSSAEKLYANVGKEVSMQLITLPPWSLPGRAQLPKIPASQATNASKKRKLSKSMAEVIDLANDDESGAGAKVYESLHKDHEQLLMLVLKKYVLIGDLTVIDPPKDGAGRKVNTVTDQLSVACSHVESKTQYWKCIAPACNHFRAGNRQQSRILKHAIECPHLSSKLKGLANDMAIDRNAPGAKVNPMVVQVDAEGEEATHKKAKTVQSTLASVAVATGKIKHQDRVNLAIVELFSVSGIPARVLDLPQWKDFVDMATHSKCNPPSSTMLMQKLIPAQAALVRKYQADFLRTCVNLTLTFDGGSTRKPSSVYTIHITTADRETFFVEGCDATDERHTAEYIEGIATEVRDQSEVKHEVT